MFAAGTNVTRTGGRTNGDGSGAAKPFTGTFLAAIGGFKRSVGWPEDALRSRRDRRPAQPQRRAAHPDR